MKSTNWLSEFQHWIDATFNVTDQQSAPIMTTLLVFIAGTVLGAFFRFLQNSSKRNAIRHEFYLLVGSMADTAKIQAEGYLRTSQNLGFSGLKPVPMDAAYFYQHSVLKDMGYTQVLESIFSGFENWLWFRLIRRRKKIKAFHKCWEFASSIPDWQERAANDIQWSMDYYNITLGKRNGEAVSFEKLVFRTTMQTNGDPNANYAREILKKILKLKDDWVKKENYTAPDTAQREYITPVMELISDSQWPAAVEMIFILNELTSHFENMKKMIDVKKEQFAKYADHMELMAAMMRENKKVIKRIF